MTQKLGQGYPGRQGGGLSEPRKAEKSQRKDERFEKTKNRSGGLGAGFAGRGHCDRAACGAGGGADGRVHRRAFPVTGGGRDVPGRGVCHGQPRAERGAV